MVKPKHNFQIWESINKQYYWVYYDGNAEPLVTSETYITLSGAQQGLSNFISEMREYTK